MSLYGGEKRLPREYLPLLEEIYTQTPPIHCPTANITSKNPVRVRDLSGLDYPKTSTRGQGGRFPSATGPLIQYPFSLPSPAGLSGPLRRQAISSTPEPAY